MRQYPFRNTRELANPQPQDMA